MGELTDKPEDNIESTLEDTDYEVKPALLTLEFDVELERAKSILDRNNGMLDAAIEELTD